MINFYLSAAGVALLALIFVVYPIFKAKKQNALQLSNASVVKQRMLELEREVEEGLIDSADKDIAIKELKVALVDEMPKDVVTKEKVSVVLFLVLAIPALLIGAWVYWQSNQLLGLKEYEQAKIDIVSLREQMQETGGQGLTPNDYAMLALSIRTKLRDEPEDVTGWSTLGLVSSVIGRIEESVSAYEKALKLAPQNDNIRFKYAETLMLAGSEDHLQNASRQLQYLIAKSDDNRNENLLLTTVAIKLQDAQMAANSFNAIKDQLDPNSQFYQSIVTELAALGVNIAQTNANGSPSNQVSSPQASNSATNEILVSVNISDALRSKLPNNAYLIVFAQRNDGASRAPLAVKRMPLGDLPVQVSLSDADAMIPSMNLGSVDKIKLTARISLDENVMPAAGELEGSVVDIDLANKAENTFTVTINKELK